MIIGGKPTKGIIFLGTVTELLDTNLAFSSLQDEKLK